MIISIGIICLYLAWTINVDILRGLALTTLCFVLILIFESYELFCSSFLVMLVFFFRLYGKKRNMVSCQDLMSIIILNVVNVTFSGYSLAKVIYFYPHINEYLIEITPFIYITFSYISIITLLLAYNNFLSAGSGKSIQRLLIKTIVMVCFIVLLIIITNAGTYFIIHNYPYSQYNGIFEGNFLRDPVQYYYRYAKALPDCIWFSATTFFTVGYGDMHPVGNIMYLLSMMEMISAYILGIVIIPILLFKVAK